MSQITGRVNGGYGGRARGGKSRSVGSVSRSSACPSTSKGTPTKRKASTIVKTNRREGVAFEKKIAAALKESRSIKTSSVRTQVPTKNRGRADIVCRDTSGEKYVVEAKNYRGNSLTKSNVKQVKGYGKSLNANPVIVASKTTKVPAKVKQYAKRNNVGITKF